MGSCFRRERSLRKTLRTEMNRKPLAPITAGELLHTTRVWGQHMALRPTKPHSRDARWMRPDGVPLEALQLVLDEYAAAKRVRGRPPETLFVSPRIAAWLFEVREQLGKIRELPDDLHAVLTRKIVSSVTIFGFYWV